VCEKIVNSESAIEAFLSKQKGTTVHFVLEATGTYSDKLIQTLAKAGVRYSVVSPFKSKSWSVANGRKNKTDSQDAQNLAEMGVQTHPKCHILPSVSTQKRQQAIHAQQGLKKQKQALQNQIHALEQLVEPCATVLKLLQDMIPPLETHIEALQALIQPPKEEPKLERVVELITSIPGIGKDTASKIVGLLGDLSLFQSAKTMAAYIGLSPCQNQSGTMEKKAHISNQGIPILKSYLYTCAMSAIRYNSICKAFYRKLVDIKHKKKKVALVAVMHKLARIIWGVVHSDKTFSVILN
jgi:transposase